MFSKKFAILIWQGYRARRIIGTWGILAAFVTIACGSFYNFLVLPQKAKIVSLQNELNSREHFPKKALPRPTENLAGQLTSFYNVFPPKSDISGGMAKLYSAGTQQGLIFEHGDYKLLHERDLKLIRYDIVFPVKGGYLQIRKFVAQVLDEIPNLAMESIAFNRQKSGDASVDAQIHFCLYVNES